MPRMQVDGLGPQTPRPSQAERPLRRASRSERIRADVAQLARAAFGPGPHRLEERRDPVDRLEVLRAEAQLEIPPPVALRAQAGAGEVRAAQVDPGAVHQHGLEVDAGTDLQLEPAAHQRALAVERRAERA